MILLLRNQILQSPILPFYRSLLPSSPPSANMTASSNCPPAETSAPHAKGLRVESARTYVARICMDLDWKHQIGHDL